MLIVLALLGATAAAFAFTERVKLERSPITGTRVDRVFSPVCECARNVAVISFVLRRGGTVTVDMLDGYGRRVRRLVRDRDEPKGRVAYTWDGRDDLERIVQEGIYRPRVELEERGRTIVLPNPMRVDTTAPRIRLLGVASAGVLARRRRASRPRHRTLRDRRAGAGDDARRREAPRPLQVPLDRGPARLVRACERAAGAAGHVRDSAARLRPSGQPVELAAERPGRRALHRAGARAHRGCRG